MKFRKGLTVGSAVFALVGTLLVGIPPSAQAVDIASPVVISEVYGGGGNSGATLTNDFIELYNNGTDAVDLSSWSVQYASAGGSSWAVTSLTGSIPPGSHFLIGQAAGAGGTDPLPPLDVTGTIAMSGSSGKVALVNSPTALTCGATCSQAPGVVDFVGYGTASDFAGTGPTGTPLSSTTSAQRTTVPFTNTGNNAGDFTTATPTPKAPPAVVEPPVEGGDVTIAEIQGIGDVSPLVDTNVTTRGVVTAAYPTGGFSGYVIQTPGTGGDLDLATHGASDGLFVFSTATVGNVAIGDYVEVTGVVTEYFGLTELTVTDGGDLVQLDDVVVMPKAISNTWPGTETQRESIESMLFAGSGDYTISNTYSTNQYGEIGLATGLTPLMQWTDVARPNSAEANAVKADNAARGVALDDGASTNFLLPNTSGLTPPYVSLDTPLRVGEQVTFVDAVIVDYRNNTWKLQPSSPVSAAQPGDYPATWTDNRAAAPADVGGDLTVASFNVLNYFTTLGVDVPGCTSYNDRAGNGITTRSCTVPNGPRGAWDAPSLARQQAKIVNAITTLDADVVGLMEIENSLVVDGPGNEDEAVSTLVDALNAEAGGTAWDYVRSSADLPPASEMDVITNAIIYRVDAVTLTGDSHALGDQSGASQPFVNAREPIAQAFTPKSGGTPFAVVVNHFKSKGSAGPLTGDADAGDGQGASNASRIAQATALNGWIPTLQAQTGADDVFLAGDFNSYTQEDPMQVFYDAGWTNLNIAHPTGKQSYNYGGMNGSLDHVLANPSALARTTGADIWNINAPESIALEYSRYNSHGTLFYDDAPYRSSDHDPVLVGFDSGAVAAEHRVQILGINDFHGRLTYSPNGQEAGASVLAGAVNQLRAESPNTVFAAAGDLIGASTFDSFIAHDKPTIDALNAAGLEVSAVGNHEFDQGYDDLINRVMAPYDATDNPFGGAQWEYLGANVKVKASGNPALDPTWVRDFGGVQVGFIGAVTEHLDELVSPAGIAELDITDIPTAVNEEADQLEAEGVDIIVLLVHEGAPTTSCDSVTGDNDFGKIVNGVNENVDAIVSGHTHLTYNCLVPVDSWIQEGRAVTERPVVSAGQYGYNLDQLLFTTDADGVVTSIESNTIALTTKDAAGKWQPNFPGVAAVAGIVSAAVANADVLGAVPLGEIGGPFNRAKLSTGAENRGGESTLGNLVAEAQRWATESPTAGGAQIAFMNPGGLRADMVGSNANGYPATLTYRQAATVQPFANTLVNMQLTGAQIKTVLEQQWQPEGSSRPFLRLGISTGFTYTYDPAAAAGSHITEMRLNGSLIDDTATYSVTANSFLAAGGDNFGELANGANPRDTGKTDLQGMVDYTAANTPLQVDHTQRSVGFTLPADAPSSYTAGDTVSFTLSSLAFSTPADLRDDTVTISLGGQTLGTFPVDNTIGTAVFDEYGTAVVQVTLPAGLPAGVTTLTVTGDQTGTTAQLPSILVEGVTPPTSTATVTLSGRNTTFVQGAGRGSRLTARVRDRSLILGGTVSFYDNGELLRTVRVVPFFGLAGYTVPNSTDVGTHPITAVYAAPDGSRSAASNAVNVTVTPPSSPPVSTATVTLFGSNTTFVQGTGRGSRLSAQVRDRSLIWGGTVSFYDNDELLSTVRVVPLFGSASYTVPRTTDVGTHPITAVYTAPDGSRSTPSNTVTITVEAAKKAAPSSVRPR